MRASLALILCLGCSLVTETGDLAGGTRDGGADSATADTNADTCVPEDCIGDLHVVKLAELAPCSATTEGADKLACRAKIAAACRALNPCCYKGGYGPLEFPNPAEAAIYCLYEPTYVAPFSELTAQNAKCVSTDAASRECDKAAHLSSLKRGHSSAVLQSVSGADATLIGLESGASDELSVPWAELTKLEPSCTLTAVESQACTVAVHRYCLAQPDGDYVFGYGPIDWTATDAKVLCSW